MFLVLIRSANALEHLSGAQEREATVRQDILTQRDQVDAWLKAPLADALHMQKPLPDGVLKIVARGEKEDGALAEMATAELRLL